MYETKQLQEQAINTIRFLSADGVQQANSGHPGLPMGTAPMAYTIWTRHLRHNPANPNWPDRDRFILSGGHGSMLLYSLLHLTGYNLPLDELKRFRQWESLTPGHPEYGLTPGIETTTGPLGQGLANGVGMAMAESHLAQVYNRPGHEVINHYIYGIVTDGDLMEGVASEAASLAGHLRLGKLIYLYDDNRISIEGSTDVAFTEDRGKRFEAYGWHVQRVANGLDVEAIDEAIRAAELDPRPSLIMVPNVIGYGLPTRAGTAKAHGEPPGDAELNGAKEKLGWPLEPRFYIPDEALALFRQAVERGAGLESAWQQKMAAYRAAYPDLAADLERRLAGKLPEGWDAALSEFPADVKGLATRASSGKVLNALAGNLPDLFGGSADLAPSTLTWMNGFPAYGPDGSSDGNLTGRNIHFGVREHGMGAIVNGMSYHGGVIPYGSTFMVFSDYMRPAVRLSALSHLGSIWVFTHDSIGVGEDGPTHQPVEQLAALRAIPNLITLRPADANEVRVAWKVAVENRHRPTALVLTRQNLPTLDRSFYASEEGVRRGAYVLADLGKGKPQVILMSSGSEVGLIIEAGKQLADQGVAVRLVSFPSWELFNDQDQSYRDSVLLPGVELRVSVEAGISQGWHRWTGSKGRVIGLDRYGASAPANLVFKNLGFSVENVLRTVHTMLAQYKEKTVNASVKLAEAGQSVWYDNIQRRLLKNGELARMIAVGEIRGVTSNPTIFMNAITKSSDYDDGLAPLAKAGKSATEIFYQLAVEDIQEAADLFQPLYQQTGGGDGYVSIEVSPYLAHDTAGTVEEAKRLWARVNRPNVMIKIPATKAGLPAITEAIASGINVNVTLIFSRQRYAEVMAAYSGGLEQRLAKGLPINSIASVASFFVSRVDTNVDARLQALLKGKAPQAAAAHLLGKAAIANTRLAYADFKAVVSSNRFQSLKQQGARPQRPLWASTGTKNKAYRDVVYIEELVGPETVNTIPPATLAAFLDHGVVRPGSLEQDVDLAARVLAGLEALGISMAEVTQQLEDEGVKSFADAFTELLDGVEKRRQAVLEG